MKRAIRRILDGLAARMVREHDGRINLSLLERNESACFLDLGCAEGDFTVMLGNRIGTKRVYGVEISPENASLAEANGINVIRADLNERLPLGDETFDVVHSNQVLEHLYNTDTFVKEIWRVLKVGGYAVVSTPNLSSLHSVFMLLIGFQPTFVSDEIRAGNPIYGMQKLKGEYIHPAHNHLRIFNYRSLKEIFAYYGFKVEKAVGESYYPLWGKLARLLAHIDPTHSANIIIKARKVKR
jgi:SAM-dependent methyltransferase